MAILRKKSNFWVDAQWHSDPPASGEGGGQELEVPEASAEYYPDGLNGRFDEYDDEIEIVSPEEAQAQADQGPTREELQAELEQLKAQAQPDDVSKLQQEVEKLQSQGGGEQKFTLEQLKQIASLGGGQQQQQQPQESEEDFHQRVKENLLDSPVKVLDEYFGKKIAPALRQTMANNQHLSQKFLELDTEKGPMYKKYKEEVDAAVNGFPPETRATDPQVYQKAYSQVMATHIDDIVNQRVEEALQSQGQSKGKKEASSGETNPLTGRPKQYYSERSDAPSPGVPGAGKKRVVVSNEELAAAQLRGVSKQSLASWKSRHPGQSYPPK